MTLTLRQSLAIRNLASVLYSFLPGSSNPKWKGHVSYATISRDLSLSEYWRGGTKEPAIAHLLEQVLDSRSNRFEPLLVAIVRNGITYRQKRNEPITRSEIGTINELLIQIGFKFPDLIDEGFLNSLPDGISVRDSEVDPFAQESEAVLASAVSEAIRKELRERFYALALEEDRQAAGLDFEKLLNELLKLFGLEPLEPFRTIGEQIDGSLVLDNETYLLEAKWTGPRTSENDLLIFRGKIEGKSAFTRGIFVSVNGFSDGAITAISSGKSPTFFLVDGYDLSHVLEGRVELPSLLRFKWRRLTEAGEMLSRIPIGE